MFTGLIEAIGTVLEVSPSAAGLRLRIDTSLAHELTPGESLAVNGVCLTVVTATTEGGVEMDVSPQTARVTTLGAVKSGTVLNLERSLRAGARLGGHFVQGHVDATGTVETIQPQGESHWLAIRYPSSLVRYIVQKGSIAVDGISLTVAELDDVRFSVQIIPFTWEHTNLRELAVGGTVNLESDILGKYVVRAIEAQEAGVVRWSRSVSPAPGGEL
jgi:riboflavin synthase